MNQPTQEQLLEMLIGKLQGNLTSLVNVMYRGIDERLSPYDLAVGEYAVLVACFANEPITVTGLTEHVPIDDGRMSRIVSNLEDRSLVSKVRLRKDRRVVRVRTTDEGKALAPVLIQLAAEHYSNIMSKVTEKELTDLIAFIEKMTENAELARQASEPTPEEA